MPNSIIINKKIKKFNSSITVSGDKSISIRWVLFSSLASGVSEAKNLLISEDVMAAIKELGYSIGLNSENGKLQVLDFNVTFQ